MKRILIRALLLAALLAPSTARGQPVTEWLRYNDAQQMNSLASMLDEYQKRGMRCPVTITYRQMYFEVYAETRSDQWKLSIPAGVSVRDLVYEVLKRAGCAYGR